MLKEFTEKIHKRNIDRQLNKKQEEVNKLFEQDGCTDEVLLKQVEINRIRNKENIADTNQQVHKEFVQ